MIAKLLALAAALQLQGPGTVQFVNFQDTKVVKSVVGEWEVVGKSTCDVSTCNAAQCTAATNILADAGMSPRPRFVDCDFRIGQKMRNLASDAGVALSSKKYQRLRLIALRAVVDGGVAFSVPLTDAGWPVYAAATATPLCVRAPLDGGTNCQRKRWLRDGGSRFMGAGSVMPTDAGVGAQCEPVACSVFFGDNPDTDL